MNDHNFKRGDLVLHVPSGCVGIFYGFNKDLNNSGTLLRVGFPNQRSLPEKREVGTWWRVLDCRPYQPAKRDEPQGWITSRRPTEADTWEGYVVIAGTFGPEFVDWQAGDVGVSASWQPVPQCLRTPPAP